MNINEVYSVSATQDDCLILDIKYTGQNGVVTQTLVPYRASDPYSVLTPLITQWIADNNPEILPYVPPLPPAPEELRAAMPVLTPRQFRDALIDADIMPDHVTAAISHLTDEKQRAKALNAWEYPTKFTRTDPLIDQIGTIFSLTSEQIDTMWREALVT